MTIYDKDDFEYLKRQLKGLFPVKTTLKPSVIPDADFILIIHADQISFSYLTMYNNKIGAFDYYFSDIVIYLSEITVEGNTIKVDCPIIRIYIKKSD